MKKYSHVYLLSDVDGTLLNDQKNIPERNLEAIKEFVAQGGHFGLATGRSQFNVEAAPVPKEFLNSPSVLSNGATLYDFISEKPLFMGELNHDKLCELVDCLIATRSDSCIQLCNADGIYRVNPNKFFDDPLLPTEKLLFPPVPWQEMTAQPVKVVNYYPPELMPAFKADFPFEKFEGFFSVVNSGEDYLEFLPVGCTKGSALNSMRGFIPKGSVIYAIGDYLNDYEMLQCADVPVTPANADPRIKALARHIVCSNNEGAVADLIQNVIFKQE